MNFETDKSLIYHLFVHFCSLHGNHWSNLQFTLSPSLCDLHAKKVKVICVVVIVCFYTMMKFVFYI